jgi:hypothetical protein
MDMSQSTENLPSEGRMAPTLEPPQTVLNPHAEQLKAEGEIASDTDGGERATREKLKKTSINALPKYKVLESGSGAGDGDDIMRSRHKDVDLKIEGTEDLSGDEGRGRPTRKRSYDDLQAGYPRQEAGDSPSKQFNQGHARKKSREAENPHRSQEPDMTSPASDTRSFEGDGPEDVPAKVNLEENPADPPINTLEAQSMEGQAMQGEQQNEPKKKRSRDQFDKDDDKEQGGSEESNGAIVKPLGEPAGDEDLSLAGLSRRTTGEPDKKRHRESSQENILQHEQEGNAAKVCKQLSSTGIQISITNPNYAAAETVDQWVWKYICGISIREPRHVQIRFQIRFQT